MSTEENKAIARRWLEEIWNKGNLAVVGDLLATNFVFNFAPPGVASDADGYKQTVPKYRTAFPDMRYTVDDMVAEGGKVVVRWGSSGTHEGEFMGIAPTGKQAKVTGISIIRIVGGKIAEEWAEMDMLGMLQQLGVFAPPG